MKKLGNFILAVLVILALFVSVKHSDWIVGGLPLANAAVNETCPAGQYQQGSDKETGAIVCGSVTGCPYGDSIPLGPECDSVAPQSISTYNSVQQTETAAPEPFVGK